MFSVEHAVLYCSSVVMFRMVPTEMGRSSSFVVLPVRISGPLVSRAMAIGRPAWIFSAWRALSMTDSVDGPVLADKLCKRRTSAK